MGFPGEAGDRSAFSPMNNTPWSFYNIREEPRQVLDGQGGQLQEHDGQHMSQRDLAMPSDYSNGNEAFQKTTSANTQEASRPLYSDVPVQSQNGREDINFPSKKYKDSYIDIVMAALKDQHMFRQADRIVSREANELKRVFGNNNANVFDEDLIKDRYQKRQKEVYEETKRLLTGLRRKSILDRGREINTHTENQKIDAEEAAIQANGLLDSSTGNRKRQELGASLLNQLELKKRFVRAGMSGGDQTWLPARPETSLQDEEMASTYGESNIDPFTDMRPGHEGSVTIEQQQQEKEKEETQRILVELVKQNRDLLSIIYAQSRRSVAKIKSSQEP